ncbi:hypothetical protein NLJ89_g10916 [Agrocybe chaxingu]|uniref:3-dehydrosphinganine reductase n=1 Tax=Agrocybe chaxingu TaxID=84603 RepID=A0A9W8MQG2_9AGAR|nr:hypothetical protein NLJ89_g10916 [Agrocybe chaxingu]
MGLFSKKWNPDGKHVYITGGSTGLGLSLAQLLTRKGAHVSIVARSKEKLDTAFALLEVPSNELQLASIADNVQKERVSPSQILKAYSHALDTAAASTEALEAVCEPFGGQAPDAIVMCAGASKPMFFVEMTEEDLVNGMTNGYWVQAWTAWGAAKKMVKQRKAGSKIVLVSSTLGYMSFLGWASYAPPKHALRGLADTLQSELMLYGVDVQIFFPPAMFTPGYDEENRTKPAIVRKIESADEGLTPEQAASALFKGMESGETHITADLITTLFRASTRGSSYRSNWFLDALYDMVAYAAMPVWRSSVDKQVVEHREEHEHYLSQQGFFS